MTQPAPISFARGAPSLDIIDVDGLREAAARAFDRFYRGGHNGNGGHGSGLGLSIVQAIAAAHGGHAMLKSAQGEGTSVQVWIPFQPPAAGAEQPLPPEASAN